MPSLSRGSISYDLASAYLVTGARVGTWALLSALVFRRLGPEPFAMLALVRSTVGLLTYTSVGLAPAMVHALAEAARAKPAIPVGAEEAAAAIPTASPDERLAKILPYATPPRVGVGIREAIGTPQQRVYASGEYLAYVFSGVGMVAAFVYAVLVPSLHRVPPMLHSDTVGLAFLLGFGTVLRLLSEAPASLLQVHRRIALDNLLLATAELTWLVVGALLLSIQPDLPSIGLAFTMGGFALLLGRTAAARFTIHDPPDPGVKPDRAVMRRLVLFGFAVVVAQAADFLYAPTDYILINRLIDPSAVAIYAPAVQIDAGLLLLVSGLASVLLPRAALAHAADDRAALRRYYVRGTLASLGMLLVAATCILLIARPLLHLWLGSDMPQTRAILPLLLIHTVIGGTSAVGRSVLLAMGKVKPFTIAVVIAGTANVLLSFTFVYVMHLGLPGIIYGTIIAVVGRCAIWMPWYILRTLNQREGD